MKIKYSEIDGKSINESGDFVSVAKVIEEHDSNIFIKKGGDV